MISDWLAGTARDVYLPSPYFLSTALTRSRSIASTVLNGRVYDAGMNEVAPRQRPRAPFWFAETGGEGWAVGVSDADSHGHGDH